MAGPEGFEPCRPFRVLDLRVSLVRLRASAEASSAALPFQGISSDAWLSYGPAEIEVALVALKYCSPSMIVGVSESGRANLHWIGFA